MKVTFLGTGTSQGVPVIGCTCNVCQSDDEKDKRLRTSIRIESKNTTLVVDSGPDFRQQMLRVNANQLDAVVFTHEHKDHIAGLDDIRAFNYVLQKPIDIYATKAVQVALEREFHYIFFNKNYPGIPQINMHTISNQPFKVGDIELQPIEVLHMKLPVLGYRINDFTYITDANYISEENKEKIRDSKILVLNALRKETHPSHFTLQEAIDLIDELNVEQGILTHISHQLGTHEEVSKELPDHISIAYDNLVLET